MKHTPMNHGKSRNQAQIAAVPAPKKQINLKHSKINKL